MAPTVHPKILRARDAEATGGNTADIEALIQAARENRPASAIRGLIVDPVPEYGGQSGTGEFELKPQHHVSSLRRVRDIAPPLDRKLVLVEGDA